MCPHTAFPTISFLNKRDFSGGSSFHSLCSLQAGLGLVYSSPCPCVSVWTEVTAGPPFQPAALGGRAASRPPCWTWASPAGWAVSSAPGLGSQLPRLPLMFPAA